MSIHSYIDSTFSSYEDLKKKVDGESARLKADETNLLAELDAEKLRSEREAEESIDELKNYFLQLNILNENDEIDDVDVVNGIESGNEKQRLKTPELLKTKALPDDIEIKLNGVRSLLQVKLVIGKLKDFEFFSRRLQAVIETENGIQSDEALELYDQLADIGVELVNKVGIGRSTSNSKSKSYNSFDNTIPDAKVIKKLVIRSIDYVNNNILNKIRENTRQNLKECLEKNQWPDQKAFKKSNPNSIIEFQKLFSNGLKTERKVKKSRVRVDQGPNSGSNVRKDTQSPSPSPSSSSSLSPPNSLNVFDMLAHGEEIRFRFHFETDKPTNRIDKPEWMFNFIINTIDSHNEFLMKIVQPALISITRFNDRISVHEFIISLLPFIYKKLLSNMKQLTSTLTDNSVTDESYILSHFVHEIISFDNLLKSKYYFTPHDEPNWKGIAGDILSTDNYFNKWLVTEKNIALKRYQEIDTPDNWEIYWDAGNDNEISITKSTITAINIKDLFESLTEHYSSIRSVKYRLKFLLEIQIYILDKYYERLNESIKAFDSYTSSIGITAEDREKVSGEQGLTRLCRTYGSLSYIVNALEEWGEDLFFLELWQSVSQDNEEGTLFDETIHSYQEMKQKVGTKITEYLRNEVRNSLDECYRKVDWMIDNTSSDISITPKLVRTIQAISQLLGFLRRFQSANDYNRTCRNFASELSKYIWNRIIQANRFTTSGGKQLLKDIEEMWTIWLLPRDISFIKLEQACIILSNEQINMNFSDESIDQLQQNLNLTILTSSDIRSILPRRKTK